MTGHWTGRPLVDISKHMVMLTCPYGHLLLAAPRKEWAGSREEASATNATWTCNGYVNPNRRRIG